jgi:hypothetical protein
MSICRRLDAGASSARFVNRAEDCTSNREHQDVASDPATEHFCCYRLHRISDEVVAGVNQRDQKSKAGARPDAATAMTRVKHRQEECHYDMAKDQPREVVLKLCFSPPKRGHFHVGAVHQLPVPDKAEGEDENEDCDECDKEFFPVHEFLNISAY